MAGKTKINGTAYTINGGKTKVGGTAYSINGGKILKGGTGYDISFSRLPSAYQEVEYIESTGTQWIDTGVLNDTNIGCEAEFAITSSRGNFMQTIWGSHLYKSGNTNYLNISHYNPPTNSIYAYLGAQYAYPYARCILGTKYFMQENLNHDLKFKMGTDLQNLTTYYNMTDGAQNLNLNALIFAFNFVIGGTYGSDISAYASCMRLYRFKMTQGSTLIRDFIPCYRKSDGVAGLYDLISKRFYTNAGTGTFTKGPNV